MFKRQDPPHENCVSRDLIPCFCSGSAHLAKLSVSVDKLAHIVGSVLPKLKGTHHRLELLKASNKLQRDLEEFREFSEIFEEMLVILKDGGCETAVTTSEMTLKEAM